MLHGEYKTAGGKLVIVDFDVVADLVVDVSVSGDFFLEPPEALDVINMALEGLSTDASQELIEQAIRDVLPEDVEMVGFSPEAVAIALRRGLTND
jgi:lipoate---protein ligase